MDETEAIKERVQQVATGLIEHCDSVQIFVTMHDGGTEVTKSYEYGKGNFLARRGQVEEWLLMINQFVKNEADRRDEDHDEDD